MARAARAPRIHGCNVLADSGGVTRLWTFVGSDTRPGPGAEIPSDRPIPAKIAGKGWGQLFRRRVDIAWTGELPVFLQLVRMPTDDPAEIPAMLEMQLEKISPLPAAQVAWSFEVLPGKHREGLGVLVLIAERGLVETLLGGLEKRGFYADRVESPLLQWVAGTSFDEDGAYLFSFVLGSRRGCLIGWVVEGALQSLTLVNLADDERWVRQLVDELNRLAWAGEMEGWLPSNLSVHLLADEATVTAWSEPLEKALGLPVKAHPRAADPELAAASASRTATGQRRASLLPPEYATRYRQQFTDRLWMGGLGALLGVYLIGLVIYFAAVEVQKYRQGKAADEFAQVNTSYTNTLRLKAQTQVLQETVNLRYAALDSWLATIESMPEELTLDKIVFSGGQSLSIAGTAPADQEGRITEYWQALRRKVVAGTNLFTEVQLRPTVVRNVQGTPSIEWSFLCTLRRAEL